MKTVITTLVRKIVTFLRNVFSTPKLPNPTVAVALRAVQKWQLALEARRYFSVGDAWNEWEAAGKDAEEAKDLFFKLAPGLGLPSGYVGLTRVPLTLVPAMGAHNELMKYAGFTDQFLAQFELEDIFAPIQQELRNLCQVLEVGDKVITSGGLHGTIVSTHPPVKFYDETTPDGLVSPLHLTHKDL